MEQSQPQSGDEIEWISWPTARTILVVTGVLSRTDEPTLLAEWAEQGLLLTRARHLITDGKIEKNALIPLSAWRAAREQSGRNLSEGHIECEEEAVFDNKRAIVRARNIEVAADTLRELLPMDEEDVEALREHMASEYDTLPASETGLEKKRETRRGRKKDDVKWTTFWMSAIQLAHEDRLSRDFFKSQAALSEELLTMMGNDPYSPDHVKSYVAQIYKKFVETN